MLNGENDSQTPVQQALPLQQRLTEVNHPDHTLITYPNLGHLFYPSSQWQISCNNEYFLCALPKKNAKSFMPSLVDLQFINYLWLVIYLPLGGKIESNLF